MSLIDSTYFIREIHIAGLSNTVDSTNSLLSGFITKYEARYLKELMGETMYNEFIAGLKEDPISDKWINLKNKIVFADTKESPIANYVYFFYQKNLTTTTSGIGETRNSSENSDRASAYKKMVDSWNEMVKWNYDVVKFINDNIADYPDYKPEYPERYFDQYPFSFFWGVYFCHTRELFTYKNSLGL